MRKKKGAEKYPDGLREAEQRFRSLGVPRHISGVPAEAHFLFISRLAEPQLASTRAGVTSAGRTLISARRFYGID